MGKYYRVRVFDLSYMPKGDTKLLPEGWEPFAVARFGLVWARKEIQAEAE